MQFYRDCGMIIFYFRTNMPIGFYWFLIYWTRVREREIFYHLILAHTYFYKYFIYLTLSCVCGIPRKLCDGDDDKYV